MQPTSALPALLFVLALTLAAPVTAQAPKPLVITAHNVTGDTASGRENKAVARPGDVIR